MDCEGPAVHSYEGLVKGIENGLFSIRDLSQTRISVSMRS
jgi:hypothetical protein